MDYAPWLERFRSFVPPRLWRHAYHVYAWSALLRGARSELGRNAAVRGCFRGRRGFVVGNGASLDQLDLSRLRGELTFTVNSFFGHAAGFGFVPTCHLFIDGIYFDQKKYELEQFAATRDPQTLCFVPWKYRDVARSLVPDAHYLVTAGMPESNRNLDLARPIPELRTVTLAALLTALHLGCDPIYLIGCDMNFLSKVVAVDPLRIASNHFYGDRAQVEEVPAFDYPSFLYAIYQMIDGFRFIKQEVDGRRQIYNAGVGGLLDVFPRVDYASLFR
jgi:hypothetical protein